MFIGEKLLNTHRAPNENSFADVHYYFDALDRKPAHDRFEKDSHLYLFHDLAQGRTRLEVANNVNTKGQDSFYGCMCTPYSLKYSTL